MADRIKNIQLSDRAKLGIAGTLAVFVAAFLGATAALALENDGPGDHPGGPQFGLAAASGQIGGPSGQMPGLPGQPQRGIPTPPGASEGAMPPFLGAPGGDSHGGLPTPLSRGFPDGQSQGSNK